MVYLIRKSKLHPSFWYILFSLLTTACLIKGYRTYIPLFVENTVFSVCLWTPDPLFAEINNKITSLELNKGTSVR